MQQESAFQRSHFPHPFSDAYLPLPLVSAGLATVSEPSHSNDPSVLQSLGCASSAHCCQSSMYSQPQAAVSFQSPPRYVVRYGNRQCGRSNLSPSCGKSYQNLVPSKVSGAFPFSTQSTTSLITFPLPALAAAFCPSIHAPAPLIESVGTTPTARAGGLDRLDHRVQRVSRSPSAGPSAAPPAPAACG